ncbi:MAG: cell wall-binding repeat-containing protein [Microcella pacifica]|uniref:cell wall-binding repeat-containing protein n=1 Tax=Microcella pacifica TaxID=2591847 RepID=UPI0033164710
MRIAGVALLVGALTTGALSPGAIASTADEPAPLSTPAVEPTTTPSPTPFADAEADPEAPPTSSPEPTPAETAEPTRAPDDEADAPDAAPLDPIAASSGDRLFGADRYATAVAVSQEAFATGAPIVFLASGADYPDALSAAPLAAAQGGPLLLTAPNRLPDVVAAELTRLDPAEVIITGGSAVVSDAVAAAVSDLGFPVRRVFGADRYETSRNLIAQFAPPSSELYLATGRNYPDALAAAAAAGAVGAPVLLVNGSASSLDTASAQLIAERTVQTAYIAGGTGVVSSGIEADLDVATVQRLSGSDRYATAVAINAHAFPTADRAFVATGAGYADALSGAVLAAVAQAPLFLSGPTCLPRIVHEAMLDRLDAGRVTLFGGEGVLSARVAALESCSTFADDQARSSAELLASLELAVRSLPGTYSVSVQEIGGLEARASVNGAVMQEPVSVIKVFVAYAVLDRVDRGLLSLSTATRSGVSVNDCLRVMIHVSDNYCHWDLVDLVGKQNLNNQFWAAGYRRTVYDGFSGGGIYYPAKLSTTNDLALLLSRLDRGILLSPASTDRLIDLLETQLWRSKLPSGVEAGTPVANKTGSAWSANGWYQSDAGIVTTPTGSYSIAVLGSQGATVAGVRELGRVAYRHFNGPIGTAASYSDVNAVTTTTTGYYRYASTSDPLGTIPSGRRLEIYASARTWYQVIYNGSYVWVPSSALRNYYAYPRR